METLQSWKTHRNREIQARFSRAYRSFEELSRDVVPLLERNGRIFDNYGPGVDDEGVYGRRKLWETFEGEIVANNQVLELMLAKNMDLFPTPNREIIQSFIDHAKEFVNTRGAPASRVKLFPVGLCSIFGLQEAPVGLPAQRVSPPELHFLVVCGW